jgi:hypothetical protein
MTFDFHVIQSVFLHVWWSTSKWAHLKFKFHQDVKQTFFKPHTSVYFVAGVQIVLWVPKTGSSQVSVNLNDLCIAS